MDFRENILGAFKQLSSNKGRTILTMLGMFIGIGAVIMILALGGGFKKYVSNFYADYGLNSFYVFAKSSSSEVQVTQEDIEAMKQMPEIETVMGGMGAMATTYDKLGESKRISLFGTLPMYTQKIQKIDLLAGRCLDDKDEVRQSNGIIITDIYAKLVLKNPNYQKVIGETIELTINDQPTSFEIVGVYNSKMPAGTPEEYQGHALMGYYHYIPYSTMKHLLGNEDKVGEVYGTIKEGFDQQEIAAQIRNFLNRRHHQKDAYTIQTAASVIDTYNEMLSIITIFISAVASISLLVGGIGIMNIMLVTVKERTREIGVRKALGATNKAILKQFLIEALILTIVAGIIGMLLGYLGAIIIGAKYSIEIQLTIGMILFSAGTSTLIGILFGVYPAYQAARLDPVESLRFE